VKLALAAPVAVTALVSLTGCSRPGSDEPFRWTQQLAPGAVVHVRNGAGDIVVQRAEGQTASVRGSRHWKRSHARDVSFVVSQSGNDVYICAMWRGSGKCGSGKYKGRQTGTLLSMFSLFHRTTDAAADFVAELPANVVIDARTMVGKVEIDGMTAGVTAQTINGRVRAVNVSGPLTLSTTNGDIRLDTDSLSASDPIDVSTRRGSIIARLPHDVEGAFDISSASGAAVSSLGLTTTARSRLGRHLQGQVGASRRPANFRAVMGSVSVTTFTGPVAH